MPDRKTNAKASKGHSLPLPSDTEDWYIRTRMDMKLVSLLPSPPMDSHMRTQSQPVKMFVIIRNADVLEKITMREDIVIIVWSS